VSAKLHTVHVRVNDAATGQPTPCRVRFTDADGKYYAPLGRLSEFASGPNQAVGGHLLWGVKPYAYIDGACEMPLPAGTIHVEIYKGPEYVPVLLETQLVPGKVALRFTIERWINQRAERWISGDARVHFLTPHAALLEAAAEDVTIVNLLATEYLLKGAYDKTYAAISNLLAFSGRRPALESQDVKIVVNTLNSHPVLGNLSLLNCHRPVYPLRFGGPEQSDDWTMADWCDQCHRKRGLVVWSKVWHESAGFRFGEPLADLILGKVDAFEIDYYEDSPFDVLTDWYALLNCGFRVPLVGASGKDSNGIALGSMRTYARLETVEGLEYQNWIEAVRAGRTIATNGPFLSLTVGDREFGTTVNVSSTGERVAIRAEARSAVAFDSLELILNGKVVSSVSSSGFPATAKLEVELPITESTWLAARCRGQTQIYHRPANQRVFAHTSPVYLRVEGMDPKPDTTATQPFLRALTNMLHWVAHEARCEDKHRERLANIFRSAKEELLKRSTV
jgi:hypothetical protein